MSLTSPLKKKITAIAKKAGTGSLELAAVLWEARNPPPMPKRKPATYEELIEVTGLSRRALIYLVQVWDRFGDVGHDKEQLDRIGWTKLAVIAENCDLGEDEQAMLLAEKHTAKELPAVLKGAKARKKHVVVLRLTNSDYLDFREALLEHGAKKAANGVGLKGKEAAVMKALGLK